MPRPHVRQALESSFLTVERMATGLRHYYCALRDRWGPVQVPILLYHQIGRSRPASSACRDRVSPARFERQLQALLDAGYRVMALGPLLRMLDADPAAARKCVALTFDDGLRGQFMHAYPILRRYGCSATFFLVAGYVGTEVILPHLNIAGGRTAGGNWEEWRPLLWAEATELARNGMEIGSHGFSHRSLGRLARHEAVTEVRRSKDILETHLGVGIDLFAYPFGSQAYGDFDVRIQTLLSEAGYRGACTTVVGRCDTATDRFALRRIPVEEGDGPFRVRSKALGAYDWIRPVKERWQGLVPREDLVDLPLAAPIAAAETRPS